MNIQNDLEFMEQNDKKREEEEKKKEDDKKKLMKLFKNNKAVVENLYDKIEKGDIYKDVKETLKELTMEDVKPESEKSTFNFRKFVNLGGNQDNITLNMDDYINDEKRSRRSDSSNSLMDFDVICENNEEQK